MNISRKFILGLIFVTLINKIYGLQEEDDKILASLITAMQTGKANLQHFLVTETQNINLKILNEALKNAKEQLEIAKKQNDPVNIKKYKEAIKLLRAEPLKQELRPYFPEDISGIIEEYAKEPIKEVEEEINDALEKIESMTDDIINRKINLITPLYFSTPTEPDLTVKPITKEDIHRRIINFKFHFSSLKDLSLENKIFKIKYLAALIKYLDSLDLIYKLSGKADEIKKAKEVVKNYRILQPEVIKSKYGIGFYFDRTIHDSMLGQLEFPFTPKLYYLVYKYLYLLLDEPSIKENNIESPEGLKKQLLSKEWINELKDL